MKKILFALSGALVTMVACDVESAMDKDLYPEHVYIVGAENPIIDRDLDLGIEENTITVSVAVSGSRPSTKDVTATVAVIPDVVEEYNFRELTAKNTPYRDLNPTLYSFPSDKVTIKAGTIYNTYPIRIRPDTSILHCDSLYMLALQLTHTTAYQLNRTDTVALVRINLVNDFSGLYYMDGTITNTSNADDFQAYSMPRNLVATDDGRTVRMYHYNNEYVDGDERNYRPTHTFKITVNEDNTLSLTTWDRFALIDGGGEWVPEWDTYRIWYTFDDNGTVRRTEGFLYRERKTEEELRLLQNWIEQERAAAEEEA